MTQSLSRAQKREIFKGLNARIVLCCELLARRYGNPRHGNKRNPLDELVYIVLSTRTGEAVFRGIYRDLKREFASWNDVHGQRVGEFHRILTPGGLSSLKAYQIGRASCRERV